MSRRRAESACGAHARKHLRVALALLVAARMNPSPIALALLVAACGSVVPEDATTEVPAISAASGRAEYSFEYGGATRSFVVYVPPDHAPGRPLVVVLHGGGGSARQMLSTHPLEAAADHRGAVVVAAQGSPGEDERSFEWNGQGSLDTGVDDVGYLEQVIVAVTARLELDPARRYVAGFSGGASMAVRFAAERSEYLAAIATFAGKVGLSQAGGPFVFPPAPTTPLSVQMTYGTLDPNLEGEAKGDIQATSAQAGIDWWVGALGCSNAPMESVAGAVATAAYTGCSSGAQVQLLTVEDMPHTWPELPGDAIAGTKLVFDFFADRVKWVSAAPRDS